MQFDKQIHLHVMLKIVQPVMQNQVVDGVYLLILLLLKKLLSFVLLTMNYIVLMIILTMEKMVL